MSHSSHTLLLIASLGGCLTEDPPTTAVEKGGQPHGTFGHSQNDPNGAGVTYFSTGIDPGNPFFTSLGTNGRACASCHAEAQGFSVTPAGLQARFDASNGTDPVFRTNDGATSPVADVSSVSARRTAYAMLLQHGVFRVGIGIPATAEFRLIAIDDPYNYATSTELSLFRRPLPSTNLPFLASVMWDAREPSLGQQAIDATMGHAQATGTMQVQMDKIVAFESSLYSAQKSDRVAGDLLAIQSDADGIAMTNFYIGINDPLGHNPTNAAFDPHVFSIFDGWHAVSTKDNAGKARAAIYRGQQIFNTKQFAIRSVKGLNDMLGADSVTGTCSLCHDTPNVGNHSFPLALDLGLTDESVRLPGQPLYTLENIADGRIAKTTDPGRALITGKWDDIGKFKGPVLRGLAMRPPYFHNGLVDSLDALVSFYDGRFDIGLSAQEHADLVAFLQAL